MTIRLVYHEVHATVTVSPFEEAVVAIARTGALRMTYPYLTVRNLEKITALSVSWKLITDVEEWLYSLTRLQREAAYRFMAKHAKVIRHLEKLHAKVVIGSMAALVGSANLTDAGMNKRTEMSVSIEDEPQVEELRRWFDQIWEKAAELPLDRIPAYIESLPERELGSSSVMPRLFPTEAKLLHPFVTQPQPPPNPALPTPTPTPASLPSQFAQVPTASTQFEIIDAIMGAFPYSEKGNWMSSERQIELLRLAYDAKLIDGRNAFPAMHGGAERGDATRSWDGGDRIEHRIKKIHCASQMLLKDDGKRRFMLAKGVSPAMLGASQAIVDALAAHGVITRYDVNGT